MQEYSRQFAREYPPDLWQEPGLTESTVELEVSRENSFVGSSCSRIFHNELMLSFLSKAGQRPFFTPQMQQVRPRWQPMHSQQQVRPPGMQGMPGGQVPRARGIRQVPPRGVPGQQQPGGAGGPSQRVGGMGQAQVRGPGAMQQGPRPAFKFQQNVRNQPAQGHPGAVPMQPQEQVPQTIQIPVSVIDSNL